MIIVESTYVCARAGAWSTLPSPAPGWAHGAETVRYAVDVVAGMTNWLLGCKSDEQTNDDVNMLLILQVISIFEAYTNNLRFALIIHRLCLI